MPVPTPRIEPKDQILPGEDIGPGFKRIEVVEGDVDAACESLLVLPARRKIRREQHAVRVEVGKNGEDAVEFAFRDALEAKTEIVKDAEDIKVCVGFDGVKKAGQGRPALWTGSA